MAILKLIYLENKIDIFVYILLKEDALKVLSVLISIIFPSLKNVSSLAKKKIFLAEKDFPNTEKIWEELALIRIPAKH